MLYTDKKTKDLFTITRDHDGWLIIPNKPPFYSIRYFEDEDMYQVTFVTFKKLPNGFQYSLSQGKLALRKAIANSKKQQEKL